MGASSKTPSDIMRATSVANTPAWYSPLAHFTSTVGIGIATMAVAIFQISDVSWPEAIFTPLATFIFANFVEWWLHKEVMHRPRRFLSAVFNAHTRRHHVIYTMADMSIREKIEWRFVLISAREFAGVVAIATIVALAVGLIFGSNVGFLALFTQAAYVTVYELTHLAYHLPEKHFVRSIPFINCLGEHHARHHDLGLMGRWNFNITFPLADLVLGTLASQTLVTKRKSAYRM